MTHPRITSHPTDNGFTIIETLIVLAIAAFILSLLFLIIPAAQRNSRNYSRKHNISVISSQLQQYYSDNGILPMTAAQGAAFISGYVPEVARFDTVTFRTNSAPHSDIPPYDTDYVQYGHWCASHGNVDAPNDPIATAPGGDTNNHYYVVWTRLENNVVYCIDNG